MIIDSLTDRGGINIDKTSLPEVTRNRHFFDVDREVSEDQWAEIARWQRLYVPAKAVILRHNLEAPENWSNFVRMTFGITIAFPQRQAEFQISDPDRKRICDWANRLMTGNAEWFVSSQDVLLLKLALPELAGGLQFEPGVLSDLRREVLDSLEVAKFCSDKRTAYEILTVFGYGMILLPDFDRNLRVEDAVWNSVTNELEKRLGKKRVRETNLRLYQDLFESLMLLRLLDQENRMDKFLNEEMKKKMIIFFNDLKSMHSWKYVAQCAAVLRVLDADIARITPEGQIEIIRDKKEIDLAEKIPAMPVRRAF